MKVAFIFFASLSLSLHSVAAIGEISTSITDTTPDMMFKFSVWCKSDEVESGEKIGKLGLEVIGDEIYIKTAEYLTGLDSAIKEVELIDTYTPTLSINSFNHDKHLGDESFLARTRHLRAHSTKQDERQLDYNCEEMCSVFGSNFCINVLGCPPGRRRLAISGGDRNLEMDYAVTMQDKLLELANQAVMNYRTSDSCDEICQYILTSVTCYAVVTPVP